MLPMGAALDLTGQKFGRLTAIRFLEKRRLPYGWTKRIWECKCECGRVANVSVSHLRTGHTTSCGCVFSEGASKRASARNYKHGLTGRPEHWVWTAMLSRCTDPKDESYIHYGARGITFCNRWKKFANFWADMGPRPSAKHSLDRRDNNKGYSPENCRWATLIEQNNNKRSNIWCSYQGERITVGALARRLGVSWNRASIIARQQALSPEGKVPPPIVC